MKLKLYCSPNGLIPCYDDDYDKKKKLKIGEIYDADIKLARNVKLNNKARVFISLAWKYLPEKERLGFRSPDGFRKYATLAAGYYDPIYDPRTMQYHEYPISWAFDSMDDAEFSEFFERLKDVVWDRIHEQVSEEEFYRVFESLLR